MRSPGFHPQHHIKQGWWSISSPATRTWRQKDRCSWLDSTIRWVHIQHGLHEALLRRGSEEEGEKWGRAEGSEKEKGKEIEEMHSCLHPLPSWPCFSSLPEGKGVRKTQSTPWQTSFLFSTNTCCRIISSELRHPFQEKREDEGTPEEVNNVTCLGKLKLVRFSKALPCFKEPAKRKKSAAGRRMNCQAAEREILGPAGERAQGYSCYEFVPAPHPMLGGLTCSGRQLLLSQLACN